MSEIKAKVPIVQHLALNVYLHLNLVISRGPNNISQTRSCLQVARSIPEANVARIKAQPLLTIDFDWSPGSSSIPML